MEASPVKEKVRHHPLTSPLGKSTARKKPQKAANGSNEFAAVGRIRFGNIAGSCRRLTPAVAIVCQNLSPQ